MKKMATNAGFDLKIAVVGKSPAFPVVNSNDAFWPAVVSLKGLLPELATGGWPFGEMISFDTLKKVKDYFKSSGLLASGGLPEDGFEIPEEILKIKDVMPLLSLYLVRKTIEDCTSYIANKLVPEKVRVCISSISEGALYPEILNGVSLAALKNALKDMGLSEEKFEEMASCLSEAIKNNPVAKAITGKISEKYGFKSLTALAAFPFANSISNLRAAIESLQAQETDMVIAGCIDSVNPVFSMVNSSVFDFDNSKERLVGEGMGYLALKRLDDAERDEDNIYGVITSLEGNKVGFALKNAAIPAEPEEVLLELPTSFVDFISSPKGRYPQPFESLGALESAKRLSFLKGNRYVVGASFTKIGSERSELNHENIKNISWLKSELEKRLSDNESLTDFLTKMAVSEHVSQFVRLHPTKIKYDLQKESCLNIPYNPIKVKIENETSKTIVNGAAEEMLNWKKVRESWVEKTCPRRFFHDLLGVLTGTFIRRIVLENPEKFWKTTEKPVIYLANHQIGLESPLVMALSFAMTGTPIQAVAKPDHVNTWLSFLLDFAEDSLGSNHPFKLVYYDKANPLQLLEFLKKKESQEASLLVHVEGTRDVIAGQPVKKLSSVFLDMAIEKGIPIVPVRLVGGLPIGDNEEKLDFPYKNGRQDYFFGSPILPEELKAMPYGQRPKFVMEKINTLGPLADEDFPVKPVKKFIEKQKFFMETMGLPLMQAMLFAILTLIDDPCEETAMLMKAVESGSLKKAGDVIPPALKKFLSHVSSK